MKQKKVKAPIKNEAANGLKNSRGTLAMARTNDINSATAQFFVNLVDNDFLDHAGPAQLRLRGVRQGHLRHGRHRQDRQGGDHHPLRPPERAGRGRDDHQGLAQDRCEEVSGAAAGPMDAHRARRRLSRHRAAGAWRCAGWIRGTAPSCWTRRSMPSRAGKTNYQTDYRWVDLEQISPHAAVAVIAAEDQFFPFHTGFDFKSIREAVRHNEAQAKQAPPAHARRQHHHAAGRQEPVPLAGPQLRAQGPRGRTSRCSSSSPGRRNASSRCT